METLLVVHNVGDIKSDPSAYHSQVNLKFAEACFNTTRPRTFSACLQWRINLATKKYKDFGLTHKPRVSFTNRSLLVDRVYIPVISLYGGLDLVSFQRSLLTGKEGVARQFFDEFRDRDSRYMGLWYYPYNIPSEPAARLSMRMMDLWADSARKVVGL